MVAGSNGLTDQKFSHISLDAFDDDEVILAGAPRTESAPEPVVDVSVAQPVAKSAPSVEPDLQQPVAPVAEAPVAEAPVAASPVEPVPAAAAPAAAADPTPAPAPALAASKRPSVAQQGKRASAYHETTLEDLERQPMPLAQKITLVGAVVLLVAFVLYQLFMH